MSIAENYQSVLSRVAAAATRADRRSDEIKLVAVSKAQLVLAVKAAIDAGCRVFGENKVQEAERKVAELTGNNAEWHLIGHLQSNKARKAVQLFDIIHSVDSIELAKRLERMCVEEGRGELRVLIQVDLAGEETKSGIAESELQPLIEFFRECERIRFDGLMALPPFFDNAEATRPYFRRLREIRDRLAAEGAFSGRRGELSMGMSHDFEVAVEEGATIVRVGTAIFGERRYNKVG